MTPDHQAAVSQSILFTQREKTYALLLNAAGKVRSPTMRDSVDSLIDSARCNADDTCFVDKACPLTDWDLMFRGTLAGCLSEVTSRHVLAFFAKHGVTA